MHSAISFLCARAVSDVHIFGDNDRSTSSSVLLICPGPLYQRDSMLLYKYRQRIQSEQNDRVDCLSLEDVASYHQVSKSEVLSTVTDQIGCPGCPRPSTVTDQIR
jgi:hypothetical protein